MLTVCAQDICGDVRFGEWPGSLRRASVTSNCIFRGNSGSSGAETDLTTSSNNRNVRLCLETPFVCQQNLHFALESLQACRFVSKAEWPCLSLTLLLGELRSEVVHSWAYFTLGQCIRCLSTVLSIRRNCLKTRTTGCASCQMRLGAFILLIPAFLPSLLPSHKSETLTRSHLSLIGISCSLC